MSKAADPMLPDDVGITLFYLAAQEGQWELLVLFGLDEKNVNQLRLHKS